VLNECMICPMVSLFEHCDKPLFPYKQEIVQHVKSVNFEGKHTQITVKTSISFMILSRVYGSVTNINGFLLDDWIY
jgi:hypothetical protein